MPTTSTHNPTETTRAAPHGRAATGPASHPAVGTTRPPLATRLARVTPETFVLAIALLGLVAGGITMPAVAGLLLGIPTAAALGLGAISGIARLLAN